MTVDGSRRPVEKAVLITQIFNLQAVRGAD